MIKMTRDEYFDLAKKMWGEDNKEWRFECPHCKTSQSWNDFSIHTELKKEDIESYLGFSCIGRFTDKFGCDWTLGGLFQIHEVEIEFEGERYRRFKIAENKEVLK